MRIAKKKMLAFLFYKTNTPIYKTERINSLKSMAIKPKSALYLPRQKLDSAITRLHQRIPL